MFKILSKTENSNMHIWNYIKNIYIFLFNLKSVTTIVLMLENWNVNIITTNQNHQKYITIYACDRKGRLIKTNYLAFIFLHKIKIYFKNIIIRLVCFFTINNGFSFLITQHNLKLFNFNCFVCI